MIRHRRTSRRRAGAVVECAIVLNITLFIIFALMIGGLGVSRYQQVAALAREATRWAAVHGRQYADENNQSLTTAQNVYDNVIKPNAVLLNETKLTYSVTWDHAGQQPTYLDSNDNPKKNNVRVTITYQWAPEAYLGGITLSSTSVMPMSY